MVLPGMGEGDAARLAEILRRHVRALAAPHETGGPDGVVTRELRRGGGGTADGSAGPLIAAADAALYASKREGRNRVGRHGTEALRAPRSETRAEGAGGGVRGQSLAAEQTAPGSRIKSGMSGAAGPRRCGGCHWPIAVCPL